MEFETAKIVIGGMFVAFVALELIRGRFLHRERSTKKDIILDVIASTVVPALIIPSVLYASSTLAEYLVPGSKDQWRAWPWWAMFATLLIADDLTQYWWHRLSHTSWLYPLHRAHHSAPYMSVRIVYRNNLIYYAFMPGLWLSGALLYWGFLEVYVVYVVIKMSVILGAHSSVPWDEHLLRWPPTRKIMWVVERLISTPATHSAHHGLHEDDGVTHYRGNYGNLLFFWDVLFGTAKITRRRPEQFGVEGLADISWFRELLWPKREQRMAPFDQG